MRLTGGRFMRLTGGRKGGHSLVSPRGDDIRPTSDRVREALFSILGPLEGVRVLDVFAGAGTLGLEALSRGAESTLFVEINPRSLKALDANLERLGYVSQARVLRRAAPGVVANLKDEGACFDLILLDPPYGDAATLPTVRALAEAGLLSPGGCLLVEHDRATVLEDRYAGLVRQDERHYGRTVLSFFQYEHPASEHPASELPNRELEAP